jgi:hypothetical protein
MSEISKKDKIDFLKIKFPRKSYSIREVAEFAHCTVPVLRYWLRTFDIPRFRITGSSFLLQENLIQFLLRADDRWKSIDKNVGLDLCIADMAEKKSFK